MCIILRDSEAYMGKHILNERYRNRAVVAYLDNYRNVYKGQQKHIKCKFINECLRKGEVDAYIETVTTDLKTVCSGI